MDIVERARVYLNCDTDLDMVELTNLVAEMRDEIDHLRAVEAMRDSELAAVRENHGNALIEADRLRVDPDDLCTRLEKSGGREMDLSDKLKALRLELAASQAREAKLREALRFVRFDSLSMSMDDMNAIRAIYAAKADDSALRERLRAELERCAMVRDEMNADIGDGLVVDAAEAIRAFVLRVAI
jgi:chromosome segregation ATPase